MRWIITIALMAISYSSLASGPAILIHVQPAGKIAYYELIPGDHVQVSPASTQLTPEPAPTFVYQQNRYFYDTDGTPIRLQATSITNPPGVTTPFPFQVGIVSCGQFEPTTAIWSYNSPKSTLSITAQNAQLSTCQAAHKLAGSGMVMISAITHYPIPAGNYTVQFAAD